MANTEIPTAYIFNASTGESVTRPLTENEIAEFAVMQAEAEARQAEADAKVAARESALAKIAEITGLTADEVAAL
jgi:hypothetical protein